MSSSSNKRKTLATVAVGGHILIIFILWFILRDNNIQEPVFQKVISANITTQAPSHLPALNQATRDKIEKEKRQKEEAEWKQQQETLKKQYEAEAKQKKRLKPRKKKLKKKWLLKKKLLKKNLNLKKILIKVLGVILVEENVRFLFL